MQNKKQFDDEIEEINQLFSSGKHSEALEKFQDYEKRFQQRTSQPLRRHRKAISLGGFLYSIVS